VRGPQEHTASAMQTHRAASARAVFNVVFLR
jgi:hypothetical protein